MARLRLALLLALAAVLVLSAPVAAQPRPGASGRFHKRVCGVPRARAARCHAEIVTNQSGTTLVTPAPAGYGPADLQSAYNVTGVTPPVPQTIAIVDAFDDPNAESDLQVYRQQYGLSECSTANGCFRKVDQNGGTSYPAGNGGWAQEISLDVGMASAICPSCHILLVEATTNSFSNLSTAVDRAATMGATQISNSYGGGEFLGETTSQSHYNHPGVDVTVSSGDNGYGVEFPAASQYVTAVGGTTLNRSTTAARGWTESVWSGAGSGCSAYISKPSWQTDTGCSRRTVADQSAVADPNTGVAVYDTYQGSSGWLVFGGTSVAAPVIAGIDALAGGRSGGTAYGSFPYSNSTLFNDILSGSNGNCGTYLCSGTFGYDGPTGIGTPNRAGTPPPASAPVNTSKPVVSGTTTEGQTLTAAPGTWTGYPSPTYAYQWQRCTSATSCGDITGATGSSYKLTSLDVGNTIDVVVTATNSAGSSDRATSIQTASIAPALADFTLSASPSSQTVRRGGSVTYTVTLNPSGGFTSSANLSVDAGTIPSGASVTSSPANPGSPGRVTIRTSPSGPWGTWTPTIRGTSGTLNHTTTVALTVRKK